MIKSAADFIMGVWTAPEVALLVEYPLDIMEELRSLLCDELHRLSRGGGDVAGVLFGVSRGAAIRIMTWRAISRDAGDEQSPRLSRHDRAEMVRVLGMAASDPAMQGYEPLGWFCSHADGGTGLTPADIDLFENFFPNSWQVTLLLRRGPGGTARAGFFVREHDGSLRSDASYRELFIQPVRRVPGAPGPRSPLSAVAPSDEKPLRRVSTAPEESGASVARGNGTAQETTPVAPSVKATPVPVIPIEDNRPLEAPRLPEMTTSQAEIETPMIDPGLAVTPETPSTETEMAGEPPVPQSPARPSPALSIVESPKTLLRPVGPVENPPKEETTVEKPLAAKSVIEKPAAAKRIEKPGADAASAETPSFTMQGSSFGGAKWLWIGLGLLALGLVIFLFTQRTASPAVASFGLRVAAMGDKIEISWDRDSTPVWNGQRASIKIQDGPDTKQLSLAADQLHAGKTTYARETPDVAIEMIIYEPAGRESHEFARFIAPAPYAPSSPPSPQSSDLNQLRSERDGLATQVQKLKEDVRKEAARADQAEQLVRILENRLRVDGNRSQSQK
jgi:hypothetical protein